MMYVCTYNCIYIYIYISLSSFSLLSLLLLILILLSLSSLLRSIRYYTAVRSILQHVIVYPVAVCAAGELDTRLFTWGFGYNFTNYNFKEALVFFVACFKHIERGVTLKVFF